MWWPQHTSFLLLLLEISQLHGCSILKNFLIPRVVTLSVCLFNILHSYNFRKNKTMLRKFWHIFELHRFTLHMKNCCCIVHRFFYVALQKFQFINIFCSFLTTQIGTKFWYVFKLRRSDLHIKINQRIQYILFYRALQEFEYIYCSFIMTQVGTKFRYIFKLHTFIYISKLVIIFSMYFFLRETWKIWVR